MSTFPRVITDRPLWKGAPLVVEKVKKSDVDVRKWRETCRAVDARDKKECQVTGRSLKAGAADPRQALERHHLEPRSANKRRIYVVENVWTVSAYVHKHITNNALFVLDRRGEKAKDVRKIARLEWNRAQVPVGKEPFKFLAKWDRRGE